MKITAKQIRSAAIKRLIIEHGVVLKSSDPYYDIATTISRLKGWKTPKHITRICKHIVKKYAIEYLEYRKPVAMDQVQRDWYKSSFFLKSDVWLALRYKALLKHGGKCQCCGMSRKEGAIIQVDHIKPRSIYPELATDENNLSVLCRECNLGKSNKFFTDWR